jgi:hypothetical protein
MGDKGLNKMVTAFWDVAPSSLVELDRRFERFATSMIRADDGGSKNH